MTSSAVVVGKAMRFLMNGRWAMIVFASSIRKVHWTFVLPIMHCELYVAQNGYADSQCRVVLPRVLLRKALGALLRVEPNGQDRFEGMEGLAHPSKPPPMVFYLIVFVECEIDCRPVDRRAQRILQPVVRAR